MTPGSWRAGAPMLRWGTEAQNPSETGVAMNVAAGAATVIRIVSAGEKYLVRPGSLQHRPFRAKKSAG